MVWRTDIKVLAQKRFPLAVSLLFHAAVLLVFATAKHEGERIFTVELMMQEPNISRQSSAVGNHQSEKKHFIQRLPTLQSANPAPQPAKAALDTLKAKNTDNQKSEILPIQENPSLPISEKISSGHVSGGSSGSAVLTSGRSTSGFHDKEGSGSFAAKGSNSGNDIVESEFGSTDGPSFLKMIKPEYPRLARRLGKEGKVVLRLLIDEHGRLVNVEIVEKAGYGFDEAAIEAVKASSFQPAKLNGISVACKALLPVRFRLE
jgi:protein TonB